MLSKWKCSLAAKLMSGDYFYEQNATFQWKPESRVKGAVLRKTGASDLGVVGVAGNPIV
jgi:hypothetical protein